MHLNTFMNIYSTDPSFLTTASSQDSQENPPRPGNGMIPVIISEDCSAAEESRYSLSCVGAGKILYETIALTTKGTVNHLYTPAPVFKRGRGMSPVQRQTWLGAPLRTVSFFGCHACFTSVTV